jgi:membrane-associated phospholipid phosphatase
MPDMGVLAEYGFYLLCALWIGGCAFAAGRLVWLAAVERERKPALALYGSFKRFFTDRQRIANGLNGMAAFIVFATGFSVLKGAIAILAPFAWDRELSHLDRVLHFGRLPHEWLWWVAQSPLAIRLFNLAYNFWFVILVGLMFTVALTRRDTRLRHQYLIAIILVWLLGGFFVAMGFSSAGPCFFSRLGLGGDYQPLMEALTTANRSYAVLALPVQDMLWQGYSAATGSIGISAFPSMHVATAVLFALYATRRSRLAGAVMWMFVAAIMVGSIVLAWHYALDGYAGALIALLVWKATGLFLDRFAPHDLPAV